MKSSASPPVAEAKRIDPCPTAITLQQPGRRQVSWTRIRKNKHHVDPPRLETPLTSINTPPVNKLVQHHLINFYLAPRSRLNLTPSLTLTQTPTPTPTQGVRGRQGRSSGPVARFGGVEKNKTSGRKTSLHQSDRWHTRKFTRWCCK